jgi:tellurite methyltransferase
MKMGNSWDLYWTSDTNRTYWFEPDNDVVDLVGKLDKSKIMDVLDLGCGIGRHSLYLAGQGFSVTALDYSSIALTVLRQQMIERRVRIEIVKGDYLHNMFSAGSFDFALAYNVIYHGGKDDFRVAIGLISEWLRPGGLFFFTCPTRKDAKYGNGEMIASNTFRPLNSIHPGDVHYFADETDFTDFLHGFHTVSTNIYEHYWDNNGVTQLSSYWRVLAVK